MKPPKPRPKLRPGELKILTTPWTIFAEPSDEPERLGGDEVWRSSLGVRDIVVMVIAVGFTTTVDDEPYTKVFILTSGGAGWVWSNWLEPV